MNLFEQGKMFSCCVYNLWAAEYYILFLSDVGLSISPLTNQSWRLFGFCVCVFSDLLIHIFLCNPVWEQGILCFDFKFKVSKRLYSCEEINEFTKQKETEVQALEKQIYAKIISRIHGCKGLIILMASNGLSIKNPVLWKLRVLELPNSCTSTGLKKKIFFKVKCQW